MRSVLIIAACLISGAAHAYDCPAVVRLLGSNCGGAEQTAPADAAPAPAAAPHRYPIRHMHHRQHLTWRRAHADARARPWVPVPSAAARLIVPQDALTTAVRSASAPLYVNQPGDVPDSFQARFDAIGRVELTGLATARLATALARHAALLRLVEMLTGDSGIPR